MNFTEPSERVEMTRYTLKETFDEATDVVLKHSFNLLKCSLFIISRAKVSFLR